MSRFFLILLIALLPLRGWSAERMAVHMAAAETATTASAAAALAMPADCPILMQAGASDSSTGHGDSKGHQGCHSCQLCMALAAFETVAIQTLHHKPLTAAVPRADRFASADLVRAVKPPIS